jgi:hypothetical protein
MHVTTALDGKESGRPGIPGGLPVVGIDLHILLILPR